MDDDGNNDNGNVRNGEDSGSKDGNHDGSGKGGEGGEGVNNDPSITPTPTSYLCSQSENRTLKHFFPRNFHAINVACPIVIPLHNIAVGVVVEVRGSESHGGVFSSFEEFVSLEFDYDLC